MVEPRHHSELAAALAVDLRVTVGHLRRRMREQASVGDFTPSQLAVLVRLERDGPSTVTALAQAEGVRPQSMGATVAVLDSAGLVEGSPDPTDGRRTILDLTDSARREIGAGRAAREDWLAQTIESHLTVDEQHHLAAAVELLTRLLGDDQRNRP